MRESFSARPDLEVAEDELTQWLAQVRVWLSLVLPLRQGAIREPRTLRDVISLALESWWAAAAARFFDAFRGDLRSDDTWW